MYKIGIIGDRDSALGFMALGFSVFEAENSNAASEILHKLAKSEEYAVIFIIENYSCEIENEIQKYKDRPLPAIISIPGQKGSNGYGMTSMKKAVERAVGADILFKD